MAQTTLGLLTALTPTVQTLSLFYRSPEGLVSVELQSLTLNPAPSFGLEDSAVDIPPGLLLAKRGVCPHGLLPGVRAAPHAVSLTMPAPAKQSSRKSSRVPSPMGQKGQQTQFTLGYI